MGVYSEYLERQMDFGQLTAERKKQLKRISTIRGGRDVLVYSSDLMNDRAPTNINYSDLLPIKDQVANLSGSKIDLILETPGGSGEVAEDIVELLRDKYDDFAVIIPGWAKSAGTLIAMGADDILMDQTSGLGPIDAQLSWQGKSFSADALLEGMEKIKSEVEETGKLNRAYIPILQGISPGELQSAKNALDFAKKLVGRWLAEYRFKDWLTHSSTGRAVTAKAKQRRAANIAKKLCDHRAWKTHARSIKIEDLEAMKLKITDYTNTKDLCDAIHRYYSLLQMTFASNVYKLIETSASQIYRYIPTQLGQEPQESNAALMKVDCKKCGKKMNVQANLDSDHPLKEGHLAFPANNKLQCVQCDNEIDLGDARRQIEAQTKKKVLTPKNNEKK